MRYCVVETFRKGKIVHERFYWTRARSEPLASEGADVALPARSAVESAPVVIASVLVSGVRVSGIERSLTGAVVSYFDSAAPAGA
jgi:hypothetical protein